MVKAAREFEVLAVNTLADVRLTATPAVAGDALFIRTEKNLYRIQAASE